MAKLAPKLLLVFGLLAAFIAIQNSPLAPYLDLRYLKANLDHIRRIYQDFPLAATSIYFCVYLLATALAIPGAAVLTLLAGAIFGLVWGTIIVSFASSLGATANFTVSRYLLRAIVQDKFAHRLRTVNAGIKRDGKIYLLTLRLVPIFPFFLVNLVMGLSPMRTWSFYWVSQLGMLPGTFIFVNAGSQIARVDSLESLLSLEIILALTLLGSFPLIAKWMVRRLAYMRAYRGFKRPKSFDYNHIVIGGGSAGLVSSYISAALQAKVALIEGDKMGGDCLNTGCVPSKALLRSAKMIHYAKRAKEFGLQKVELSFSLAEIMLRVKESIAAIAPHDSRERYTKLGVECISGEASLIDPWTVAVNGRKLSSRSITIASGAKAIVPPFPGLEKVDYVSSDTLWDLKSLPERLVILGGGPIGCEIAQAFARLGSRVCIVEMLDRILTVEDEDVSAFLEQLLRSEQVEVLCKHKAISFERQGDVQTLLCEHAGKTVRLDFDCILIAIGRRANTQGLGLEKIGVKLRSNGTIAVDAQMRSSVPNIFACGDVCGPFQLTHAGAYQAWFCSVNSLFGDLRSFSTDYTKMPWATFVDPEIATVGWSEARAKAANLAYELSRFELSELDRAIADGEPKGFIKVLSVPGKDTVLGATIVGHNASTMILEFAAAIENGFGLNKILNTIHIYPSWGEANKYVAGTWKRAQSGTKTLSLLKAWHTWMRR